MGQDLNIRFNTRQLLLNIQEELTCAFSFYCRTGPAPTRISRPRSQRTFPSPQLPKGRSMIPSNLRPRLFEPPSGLFLAHLLKRATKQPILQRRVVSSAVAMANSRVGRIRE